MATILDDQCIALIVQDTLKLPLPPSWAGLGWGKVGPLREQDPSRLCSLLRRCVAEYPQLTKTGFPAPVLLSCPAALLPSPGSTGVHGIGFLGAEPQAPQTSTTPTASRHSHISHVGQGPTAPPHAHHPFCSFVSTRDSRVNFLSTGSRGSEGGWHIWGLSFPGEDRGDLSGWPWRAALGLPEAKVKERSRFVEGAWEDGVEHHGKKGRMWQREPEGHFLPRKLGFPTLSHPCGWGTARQRPPSLGSLQTIEDAK